MPVKPPQCFINKDERIQNIYFYFYSPASQNVFGRLSHDKILSELPKNTYQTKTVIGDNRFKTFQYIAKENEWSPLPSPKEEHLCCSYCTKYKAQMTAIGENKFLLARLQHDGVCHSTQHVACKVSILNLQTPSTTLRDKIKSNTFSSANRITSYSSTWKICRTTIPIGKLTCVNHINDGKVILFGDQRVFKVKLSNNTEDISWKELDSLPTRRKDYISFMMRGTIYVAGGHEFNAEGLYEPLLSCEKLQPRKGKWPKMNKDKWQSCSYILPYHIIHASVAVDVEETFAIIIGGHHGLCEPDQNTLPLKEHYAKISNRIIIFTEEGGFNEMKQDCVNTLRIADCRWQETSCSPVLLQIE